jgi:hypothetical protein
MPPAGSAPYGLRDSALASPPGGSAERFVWSPQYPSVPVTWRSARLR